MLVSSAPSVTSPHPPVLFLVRVRYRRGTHITSLYQSSAFSALFYNNSGHCTVVILVCIFRANCPPSPAMQRRSKSAETLTIRCTLHLNYPSSIWGFGTCQEMICIEGENANRCRGLGIISKLKTFSTRVQRPSRERPEALTQEESGFSYGQWTLTTSVLLVLEEPSKRS